MTDAYEAVVLLLQVGALCGVVGTFFLLVFSKSLESPKNLEASLKLLLQNVLLVTQIGLGLVILGELCIGIFHLTVLSDFGNSGLYFFRIGLFVITILTGLFLSLTTIPKFTGYLILSTTWISYFIVLTWSDILEQFKIGYVVGVYSIVLFGIIFISLGLYLQNRNRRQSRR